MLYLHYTDIVFFVFLDSLVKVVLRGRDTNITENSAIKLLCSVTAPKVRLTVTWKFQPFNTSTAIKDILSIHHTGEILYGKEQRDYQLEATVGDKSTTYILKVLRASKLDQGQYNCQVDVFTMGVQKAKHSNPVAVNVHKPGMKLEIVHSLLTENEELIRFCTFLSFI